MSNENIHTEPTVFDRMQSSEVTPFNYPQYYQIKDSGLRTAEILQCYDTTTDPDALCQIWKEKSGEPLDETIFIQTSAVVNHAESVKAEKIRTSITLAKC